MTVNIGDAFSITRGGSAPAAAAPVGAELLVEGEDAVGARPSSGSGIVVATPAQLQQLIKQLAEPEHISQLHITCDVDHSVQSYHHTLGPGSGQAAAGNHSHGSSIAVNYSSTGAITPAASPGTVITSADKAVIKGRRYTLFLTSFDVITTVGGDRFTYIGVADGNLLQTQTMPFPVAGVNISPTYIGSWIADHSGIVTFSVNITRPTGTGTIAVSSGLFLVLESVDAV